VLHQIYGSQIIKLIARYLCNIQKNINIVVYDGRLSNGDDLVALDFAKRLDAPIISNDLFNKNEDTISVNHNDYVMY
jgi:hypothetical protein